MKKDVGLGATRSFYRRVLGRRNKHQEEIYAHIVRYQPQEILIAESQHKRISLPESVRNQTTQLDAWIFHHDQATDSLKKQFKVLSLDGLGLMDAPLGVGAAERSSFT